MRTTTIALIFLFISALSLGQIKIQLVDNATGIPIEGAQCTWENTENEKKQLSVSDAEGWITTNLALPVTYQITHVSYQSLEGEITDANTSKILVTPSTTSLRDVVVTGQFEPQSIDQSVHTVKAIDRRRIENQGAIDLADVLSNNLNITLTPNKADGRTGISMLGLDGQYVKVLIDGIPFAGVDGNGNNADITQINLNTIERVEIVEGPMAVSYGANALAGVINLITRNNALNSVSIQEETVGSEYGLNQGRHIQTISLGHKFENGLLIQGNAQRNDFTGFRNGFLGEDHIEEDGRRGYDWHPKLQYAFGGSVGYNNESFRAKYRFDYFKQTLDLYSRIVFPDEHPSSGLTNPFALDDRNETNRFSHNLTLTGRIDKQINYSIASAYTGVEMDQLTIRKRILTDVEEETTNSQTRFLNSFTSRGNFTNFIEDETLDVELGYEYTYENVRAEDIDGDERSLNNIAGFASLEWSPFDAITFRPGVRYFHNSIFSSPAIYSLNVKYKAPEDIDIRVSFGRSYRTPNLTELYFFFVDANHDVRGNANLRPEDGYGAAIDIRKNITRGKILASSSVKLFYNNIQDQIALSVVNQEPLQFQYININRFKSQGISIAHKVIYEQLTLNVGVSYIGRYNQFHEDEDELQEFLYSPEANFNATYSLRQPNITFALFYKHTGAVEQYVFDSEINDFRKGKTNSFNWLDYTTTWRPTDHISIQGGVKNILNLTDINTTSGTAGAHSDAPVNVGLTYGRSYFLRLGYTF